MIRISPVRARNFFWRWWRLYFLLLLDFLTLVAERLSYKTTRLVDFSLGSKSCRRVVSKSLSAMRRRAPWSSLCAFQMSQTPPSRESTGFLPTQLPGASASTRKWEFPHSQENFSLCSCSCLLSSLRALRSEWAMTKDLALSSDVLWAALVIVAKYCGYS